VKVGDPDLRDEMTGAVGSAAWEGRGLFGHPVEPDFVAVDVETACSDMGSICQIGIVGFIDGRELFSYESLIDPKHDFSPFNIRVHGIDAARVVGQPCFAGAFQRIAGLLDDRVVVAHSGFDRTALAAACRSHTLPSIRCRWLDTVTIARRTWPELESHRLSRVAQHLGIRFRHHDALEDARTCGRIMAEAIGKTGIAVSEWEDELKSAPRQLATGWTVRRRTPSA
jgi:DNA polymerase-3 subunit epsilon